MRGLVTTIATVVLTVAFLAPAAESHSYLLRNQAGRRSSLPLDFKNLMRAGKDVPLDAGDIVVVPQSLF